MQMNINGLRFNYEKDRDLFNGLLKINGVTKKKFCDKFDLSYSYVNAWGSTTSLKEIKYPSWVFHYLRDVMYFKIEAIKIKIPLERIYERLQVGENLTEIYKSLSSNLNKIDDLETQIYIPDEIVQEKGSFVFNLSN
jgi:predicted AlkP superfamily pyrophosphatase or phosphodiesterase